MQFPPKGNFLRKLGRQDAMFTKVDIKKGGSIMLDSSWMSEYDLYRSYDDQQMPFEEAKQNWVLYNQQYLPLQRVLEIIKNEENEE